MKTVLITGASSGFGLETAKFFLEKGWRVVATMRTPKEDILPKSDRLKILSLDVTKADSIKKCVAEAGEIDVLVNNAGIGILNALEGTSMDAIRATFETNTFGTMAMMQAVIPQMRERKAGTVINVTSSVTLHNYILLPIYTASKAAVNAFSEVVALELEPFNVKVKVVLPGRAPDTRFGENGKARMEAFPEPYAAMVQKVFANFANDTGPVTKSSDVAEAIWRAATDPAAPARIPAGADAVKMFVK